MGQEGLRELCLRGRVRMWLKTNEPPPTYLQGSELDRFLADVVGVEGGDEVVDGDAHGCGGWIGSGEWGAGRGAACGEIEIELEGERAGEARAAADVLKYFPILKEIEISVRPGGPKR